jgi:hypothetical protein
VTKRRETTFEDAGLRTSRRTYRLPEEVGAPENRVWLSEREYKIVESIEPLPPMTVTQEGWRHCAPKLEELYDLWERLAALADELPPELLERRRDLLNGLGKLIWWAKERPLSRREIRNVRAQFVCDGRRQGMKREAAYDLAAILLEGTDFECGRDMMKKAYDAAEREIPF